MDAAPNGRHDFLPLKAPPHRPQSLAKERCFSIELYSSSVRFVGFYHFFFWRETCLKNGGLNAVRLQQSLFLSILLTSSFSISNSFPLLLFCLSLIFFPLPIIILNNSEGHEQPVFLAFPETHDTGAPVPLESVWICSCDHKPSFLIFWSVLSTNHAFMSIAL